ncbi:uncharacterized protein LOC113759300 [Coffea eugenioides]|uniref:uncharacterized protein LOC113759300 n=1 Tax=Coffea eugenioides TaxID=49369 RepID=UPI000F610E3F|nr:uncharacterized protein LOC113759300 [Coffea eugenioides]
MRLKNEKSRVTAVCGVEGCKWRIHASPVLDSMTFVIKTYQGEHTCVMDKKNTEATADWIAKKLVPVMRIHPNMSTKGVEAEMIKYGVHPSKWQMYKALTKARNEIEGNHIESYAKLPKYAELIRKYNLQSICKIHYDRPTLLVEPRFLRIFISFKAQRSGFVEGCRPFVGFDGCFLKENGFHGPLTFMSDRQKGLNIVYEERVPVASGRHCCRHICSNFKAQFPGILLGNLFWRAAKSFDVAGHNEAMASIKELNIEAWKYLDKIPKTTWCRCTFNTGLKCDHVTNNCTESFNAWIGELRGKPILTLVDGLRKKFMKKMHKRYQKGCMLTTAITPKMLGKLQKIGQASRQCELTMASTDVFEVGDMNRSYIVNLSAKTCDCGTFQISGLSCKHAALGIIYKREKLESYCEHWFSRDKYLKTYSSMIHPIPDEKMWPPMPYVTPVTVLPPSLRRAPGRPKTKRRREHDEEQSASQPKRLCYIKCGNCGSFDHNKRSCQGAHVQNKKNGNRTTGQQSYRRGKPGRVTANTGLSGATLWDHVSNNVPVVHSSQGSNPSPSTQPAPATVNVHRGRPLSNTRASVRRSSKRNYSNTAQITQIVEQAGHQQIATFQVATPASESINAATTLHSTNVSNNSSFSMQF